MKAERQIPDPAARADDDDPYGDPQVSALPVQRRRTKIGADTAANATLALPEHITLELLHKQGEGLTFGD